MASPQVEDGYTMIANELLEALAHIRISGEEMQMFLVILRKTYGFKKKVDAISLSQFCLATGVKKPNVCRSLSKLITKNMIIKIDNIMPVKYYIQKDYTRWMPLSKLITLSKVITPVIKSDNKSLSKVIPTKEKETKETITKEKTLASAPKKAPMPKIYYCFESREWNNITEKDEGQWKETYPACDIQQELRKMGDWLQSNPKNKKSNYRAFISKWLSRSQDRGGTKEGVPKKTYNPITGVWRD